MLAQDLNDFCVAILGRHLQRIAIPTAGSVYIGALLEQEANNVRPAREKILGIPVGYKRSESTRLPQATCNEVPYFPPAAFTSAPCSNRI